MSAKVIPFRLRVDKYDSKKDSNLQPNQEPLAAHFELFEEAKADVSHKSQLPPHGDKEWDEICGPF